MGKTRPPSPLLPRRRLLKKPTKHKHARRGFGFSNTSLAKYLKTDSHLYAPVANASLSSLTPFPKAKGKEPKLKLVEKIVDYLKSDSYLYSSLLHVPASGVVCQVEAGSTTMTVKEVIRHRVPQSPAPDSAATQPEPQRHGLLNKEQTFFRASYRTITSTPGGTAETMSRELRRLVG